jgi:hypothetical protein
MKFSVTVILIAILTFALGLYLPWWSLAIAAFGVIALGINDQVLHSWLGSLPFFCCGFIGHSY